MEFHLDRRLQLLTEHKSLYSWAINEVDENGKVVGSHQIPWDWSLYFTAIEIVLSDDLTVTEASKEKDVLAQEAEIEYRRTIRAQLLPGHPRFHEDRTTYRMFGTDRVIEDFRLDIHPLDTEDKIEVCRAWGCVSYTAEVDFRGETTEDCIVFYLLVKPSTFDRYVARISAGTAEEVTLRVRGVDGFYSEWSPSISTHDVKVLTPGSEHEVQLPADLKFEPPRLGSVGEASISVNAKRVQATKQPSAIADELADEEHQPTPLVRPDAIIAPMGIDPQMMKLLQSLKGAARWIIGLLVLLVISTLLTR